MSEIANNHMAPGPVSTVGEAVLRYCSIPGRPEQMWWYAAGHCCDEEKKQMNGFSLHYRICTIYAIHGGSDMKKIVRVSSTILCR